MRVEFKNKEVKLLAKRKDIDLEEPLWLRLLERHGIPSFLLFVLAYMCYQILVPIGEAHVKYLGDQTEQMKLQTQILKAIEESTSNTVEELQENKGSNERQEESLKEIKKAVEKGVLPN